MESLLSAIDKAPERALPRLNSPFEVAGLIAGTSVKLQMETPGTTVFLAGWNIFLHAALVIRPRKGSVMTDINARQQAESVFDRDRRREREISAAMELEAARQQAAIENMKRLRALRLLKSKAKAEKA
jgi:hypothetical protein